MSLEEVKRVNEKYSDYLMSLKNVISVGIGKKMIGGQQTDELCIIVGVTKKVPDHKLKNEDIVPKNIDSVKTDVIKVGKIKLL